MTVQVQVLSPAPSSAQVPYRLRRLFYKSRRCAHFTAPPLPKKLCRANLFGDPIIFCGLCTISAAFVHVFFVCFAIFISCLYGYFPNFYTIQVVYYFLCLWIFTLGLVYATSAIVVFFRDLTQIIGVFLQIGVWMTPIMWDINMLAGHPFLMKIFKFNPIYYIVTGYRDSILGRVGIWHHWKWGVYFWVITAFLFVFGSVVFKKLKVHFADVL